MQEVGRYVVLTYCGLLVHSPTVMWKQGMAVFKTLDSSGRVGSVQILMVLLIMKCFYLFLNL